MTLAPMRDHIIVGPPEFRTQAGQAMRSMAHEPRDFAGVADVCVRVPFSGWSKASSKGKPLFFGFPKI